MSASTLQNISFLLFLALSFYTAFGGGM